MLISLNLNKNQYEWLKAKMGCNPSPKTLKQWLLAGNSLEGLPPDLERGGYKPRKKTVELSID